MRKLRTLDEFVDQYFRDRPEEIDDYLAEILQEFAEDNDTGALRVIALVQDIAEQIGMTKHGVQTAVPDEGSASGECHVDYEGYGVDIGIVKKRFSETEYSIEEVSSSNG